MFHQGTVVGRYRLLATVGHGGMSDVHLAATLGPHGFHKLLVVKELRPPLAQDPEFLTMFLDEARLAARLGHPNIVQTYEVFSDAGRYFIAMEYLAGQPLHRILAHYSEQDRAPLPEYLRILAEACAGLEYAHELKDYDGSSLSVVHRDVSPHNIFVTYDGQVKVVDFGIAKARDSSAESRVGLLKGKLGYMAPEQARGEHIDRRADVFAVGVMLWELIAGRRMWRSISEMNVLQKLVAGEIPAIRSVQSDVPDELARICAKALCARIEERYATARELEVDLQSFLEALPERVDSADDCFEFFGGTVDARYLICQHGGDDGFDWDLGYAGRMQFLLLQDDPELDNDSNGFEGDNDPNGSANSPVSSPVIYNATLCGKNRDLKKQHYALLLRRGTKAKIANAIFTGFAAALDVRDDATGIDVTSSIFFGNHRHPLAYPESAAAPLGPFQDDDSGFDEAAWLMAPARRNREKAPELSCFDPDRPNFKPRLALDEGAESPPADGFFDSEARYIGAFRDRSDDWDVGAWVVWSGH